MKTPFLSRGLGLAAFFAVSVVGVSLGQGQLGNSDQIEKAWKGAKEFEFLQQVRGIKPPVDADLDLAAKFYVYRMTWDDASMAKSVAKFNDFIDKEVNGTFGDRGDNTQFKTEFTRALVTRFTELTDLPFLENSRAVVNGTQMFPGLAKMQQEEAAVYLQDIIDKSGKNAQRPGQDALRLFALRALGEMLPVTPWAEPAGLFLKQKKANLDKKDRDLARIKVITDFIERPAPTPPNPDTLAAYRYLRREAIEALAHGGWPAVNSYREDAKSKMEGPIALTLMKVIVPGNLNPPPSLSEKNEAALGLLSLKGTATYDGRPTLPFIAATLIEMNKTYAEDLPSIKAGQAHFGWKIEGARWKKAIEILVDPANGPFCKDKTNLKLADTFAGRNNDQMAMDTINAWIKHGNAINTLKVEGFMEANLPKESFAIFKDIASPKLEYTVGPRGGVDAKE